MVLQMELPLEASLRNEDPLHQAWVRSGLNPPFKLALQNRAIAIFLRHAAETRRSKPRGKRHA